MLKIGFIGCGNMGGALAEAAAKSGNEIFLSDASPEKAESLAKKIGATVCDNETVAKNCDYIFLGVKPQVMPAVLPSLGKSLENGAVLVSMAAGIKIEKVKALCGKDNPVIRIMPNTPAAVGSGMILYTCAGVGAKEEKEFLEFMNAAGRFDNLPESLIDAASAVSGCGPAFACQFIEALADGGVACGLPRDKALMYAAAMLEGTARLMLETGTHPGALKDAVCSPGGSTIEGVRCLENGAFRGNVSEAVLKSYKRTKELGE